MKKTVALLISLMLAILTCIPAYAATKSATVTVKLGNLENLMLEDAPHDLQLLNVQMKYLSYCNDVITTDLDTLTYNTKVQAQQTAKKKLAQGYLTQKEYNDAVQAVTDQLNAQQANSIKKSQDSLALRHMFGLDDADRMVVEPVDYTSVNLEQKLSGLSYTGALKHNEWYNLSGSDAEDAEITGDVEKLKQLYDSLKTADQKYQTDNDSYQKKQADAQTMQQKLKYGYATRKDADDLNSEVRQLTDTVAIDRNNVYMAYLQYDYMRDHGESPSPAAYQ